ncbi:MAG: hypothetical protein JO280_15860 [Mycobacteriaceae bacterium]|nr:hypothetical protein [Mycobacteriaceae bacterium]
MPVPTDFQAPLSIPLSGAAVVGNAITIMQTVVAGHRPPADRHLDGRP